MILQADPETPAAPVAILRLDPEGRVVACNRSAEEMTGHHGRHLIGRLAADVLTAAGSSTSLPQLLAEVGTGRARYGVLLFLNNGDDEGRAQPFVTTLLPLPGSEEEAAGALVCLHDPGAAARHHELALDCLADGVFSVDRDWLITSFNRAAEQITGWPATEAIGRRCSEVFQASICGKSCVIAESLYTGRPVTNRSISIQARDGQRIPVSISAAPLIDQAGNFVGGVESLRDLASLSGQRIQAQRKYSIDQLASKSRIMQRLFAILQEVAASPSTVLICGESGTGKELLARALYNISDRSTKPFVAVNCGALPEALLESELFGYKAGAFTDARKDKEGRFAAAEGGVLFLDEIGDVPQSIQVKLLRVLQEKVYEPLGSNTPVPTDVRIITATNRDLQALVQDGGFREDLFYRLNVVRLHLPPLRERKEDIPLLIDQFVAEFRARQAKDIAGISASALNILMQHDFPGNIRELKNIIEYAFILCDGGYILPQHLPEPFSGATLSPEEEKEAIQDRPQTLEEIEHQAIALSLEKHRWKRTATCRELGISKDTLRRKLHKYNLTPPYLDEEPDQD